MSHGEMAREREPWPLGAKLREARESNAQSLTQVATAIGGSRAHIWQLEVGACTNPTVELLQKLGGHFEICFVVSGRGPRVLAPDEQTLLASLSLVDPEGRAVLVRLAKLLAAGAQEEANAPAIGASEAPRASG